MAGTHHAFAPVAGPEGTKQGLRAIRISAGVLGFAAAAQLIVVTFSSSAGLLAAALDNLGDAVSTVALAVAFVAARRAADKRYTFGYERLEDLAGIAIVLIIWASAGVAAWQSIHKLFGEHTVRSIPIAMVVAAIGALANEVVARYKIGVGRRIGSEPLIADGAHARTDALASAAAFVGLLGVKLGWEQADPIAGLAITLAIIYIAWDASGHVLARLLDAVDPELVESAAHVARETDGVVGTGRVQARWAGRSLYVSLTVAVPGDKTVDEAHAIAENVHHRIIHELPAVAQVDVHVDPWEPHAAEAHPSTADHEPVVPEPHDHGHAH